MKYFWNPKKIPYWWRDNCLLFIIFRQRFW